MVLICQHANFLTPSSPAFTSGKGVPIPAAPSPVDVQSALQVVNHLRSLANHNQHVEVEKFALVMRLRTLVRAEMWHTRAGDSNDMSIEGCLQDVEHRLGLEFLDADPNGGEMERNYDNEMEQMLRQMSPALRNMQMHVIVVSVLYYTIMGASKSASDRLKRLHAILDATVQIENVGGVDVLQGSYINVRQTDFSP